MDIYDPMSIKSNNQDLHIKQQNTPYGHYNNHNLFIADNELEFLEVNRNFALGYMHSDCSNIWVYSGL